MRTDCVQYCERDNYERVLCNVRSDGHCISLGWRESPVILVGGHTDLPQYLLRLSVKVASRCEA